MIITANTLKHQATRQVAKSANRFMGELPAPKCRPDCTGALCLGGLLRPGSAATSFVRRPTDKTPT